MSSALDRSVAIVTGGAGGIGREYALAIAAEGGLLVVAGVFDGQPVVDEIKAAGGKTVATRADVSDESANGSMAAAAIEAFGRIDIFIANAAIFSVAKPLTEASDKSVVAGRALKKTMVAADMVGVNLYLCSDASDFVTGRSMLVNGGAHYL